MSTFYKTAAHNKVAQHTQVCICRVGQKCWMPHEEVAYYQNTLPWHAVGLQKIKFHAHDKRLVMEVSWDEAVHRASPTAQKASDCRHTSLRTSNQ